MRIPRPVALLLILLAWGCASNDKQEAHDYADLIVYGPEKVVVRFKHRYWAGFWGPEGYIGYRYSEYRAWLRGTGPSFRNPEFHDDPPGQCIGTITLDREHNRALMDMRRVTSQPEKPERTKRHPANGTYIIRSIRQAKGDEPSL
jgi:hypothetical protein